MSWIILSDLETHVTYDPNPHTAALPTSLIPNQMASSFIRNGKKVRLTPIVKEYNKITLYRSLQSEETTPRTSRSWATPLQKNRSSSSNLLRATFPPVVKLKYHKGLSHIMKVCIYLPNSDHSNYLASLQHLGVLLVLISSPICLFQLN